MTTVGTGELLYEPVENWHQLPDDIVLVEAIGVATNSQDNVYVFQRGGEPSILVFDRHGQFLRGWGEGLFVRPHGIWIAADDSLYLVDDEGHSVRRFSGDGELLQTIGPCGKPSKTGAEGFDYRQITRGGAPFNLPTNAVTGSDDAVFAVDGYGNSRVHHFSAEGRLLASWGEPGRGPSEFRIPHGLGIDREDRLYVADRENSRIQIFAPDGGLLDTWSDVVRPCQVFIGQDELVYVAELGARAGLFPWMPPAEDDAVGGRVSIFDQSGALLCRWGGEKNPHSAAEFYAPHDIWVDSHGSIYVAEVSVTAARLAGLAPSSFRTLHKFSRVTTDDVQSIPR